VFCFAVSADQFLNAKPLSIGHVHDLDVVLVRGVGGKSEGKGLFDLDPGTPTTTSASTTTQR
jgi:hypothetical protein